MATNDIRGSTATAIIIDEILDDVHGTTWDNILTDLWMHHKVVTRPSDQFYYKPRRFRK